MPDFKCRNLPRFTQLEGKDVAAYIAQFPTLNRDEAVVATMCLSYYQAKQIAEELHDRANDAEFPILDWPIHGFGKWSRYHGKYLPFLQVDTSIEDMIRELFCRGRYDRRTFDLDRITGSTRNLYNCLRHGVYGKIVEDNVGPHVILMDRYSIDQWFFRAALSCVVNEIINVAVGNIDGLSSPLRIGDGLIPRINKLLRGLDADKINSLTELGIILGSGELNPVVGNIVWECDRRNLFDPLRRNIVFAEPLLSVLFEVNISVD